MAYGQSIGSQIPVYRQGFYFGPYKLFLNKVYFTKILYNALNY